MSELGKSILGVFAIVLIATGVGFYVHAARIADTKLLGTAEENARRSVFEETKSYRDGVRRDFDELLLSYNTASTEQRPAILSVIRHRAEGTPPELVPTDVRSLLEARR